MSRPHIEFIQSQGLPWTSGQRFGLDEEITVKVLSEDEETGAASLLLRYPAGFRSPGGTRGADEEILVLGGALTAGGRPLGHLTYAHWPAGFDPGDREAVADSVVLTFFSGDPTRRSPPSFDPRRLVESVDAYTAPYTGNFHPEFPPGAGRKVLFTDPDNGETSWILGTLPVRWAERSEKHPHVEEMYLLSGESHGDRGVMRPGAYFWRPGGLAHGPYGTLTGNLYFFRTKGGPLITEYVAPETPFQWFASYRPILPGTLAGLACEAAPAPPSF